MSEATNEAMGKAVPIPDSIDTAPNGTLEKGVCERCGLKIIHAITYGRSLPWWHLETKLIYCKEENKK